MSLNCDWSVWGFGISPASDIKRPNIYLSSLCLFHIIDISPFQSSQYNGVDRAQLYLGISTIGPEHKHWHGARILWGTCIYYTCMYSHIGMVP